MRKLILYAASMLLSGIASAASFDCSKASSRVEKLICSDPGLSKQDDILGQLYRKAKAASSSPEGLTKQARENLKWREANCDDRACIEEWYANIIPFYQAQLANSNIAPKPTPTPAPPVNVPWVADITAGELLRAYSANSIAADAKFLRKLVMVRGRIKEIGRDVGGDPYIGLWADDPYQAVKLTFATRHEAELATKHKGDVIRMACIGLGEQYGTPILDCTSQGRIGTYVP